MAQPLDISGAITDAANQYGVDPDFALRIAHAESSLNPAAVSPKGALGVMQLMPDTAKGLGVDPHDVRQNIIGGVRYIRQLQDKYGDQERTAAAYNAGPGAVDKHGGVPPFPETVAYVAKTAKGEDDGPSLEELQARLGDGAAPIPVDQQRLPNVPGYIDNPANQPGETGAVPIGGVGQDEEPSLEALQARLKGGDPDAAPDAPKAPMGAVQAVTGAMANVNRGLGVGDELAAGANTVRDLVAGQSGPDVVQTFKDELAGQRGRESAFSEVHPNVAALMRGTGMAGTALVPAGPTAQAFATGTRVGNAFRGITLSALTGAGYNALDAGTLQERGQSALDATKPWDNPAGYALGAVTGGLARGAPRAVQAPTQASTLEAAGVPLTVGQRGGPLAHRLEDAAESLPLTGAAIRARKIEGLEGFDRAAINQALAPINQQVAGTGRDAMLQANQHVSNAYTSALHGVTVQPDAQYMRDLLAVSHDPALPNSVRSDVGDIVREYVTDPIAGDPSGQSWKRIDSDLNTLGRSAANGAGNSPQSNSLRRALQRVQDAHWDLLERQNPQAAESVAAADAANAAMERVRGAAATTATAGRDGLFTASDLNRSVASAGGRSGRRAYGQGTALMQDLSDAGQAVLPSSVPDSGTALRSFVTRFGAAGGVLGGVGAVGGHEAAVPAAIGSLATDLAGSAFYSRPVQNLLRHLAESRRAGTPAGVLPPEVAARLSVGAGAYGAPGRGDAPAPNALAGVRYGR